jgi:hypothetical protein
LTDRNPLLAFHELQDGVLPLERSEGLLHHKSLNKASFFD